MSKATDRAAAWVLTGPVGRIVAFWGDLGAAWLGWAASKLNPMSAEPDQRGSGSGAKRDEGGS